MRQAKALGDHLLVVVARDSSIRADKGYEPHQSEEVRLAAVATVDGVDEVIFGQKTAHKYELLRELEFDVLALGYDQAPSEEVRRQLALLGKQVVQVVRLKPFRPEKYKSTFIRGRQTKPDSEM